jgi:hypothetical protein
LVQNPVHRIDVEAQPIPDCQTFGRSAQNAGVQVRVDQTGHQKPIMQSSNRPVWISLHYSVERTDRDDAIAADCDRSLREGPVGGVHRHDNVGRQNASRQSNLSSVPRVQ